MISDLFVDTPYPSLAQTNLKAIVASLQELSRDEESVFWCKNPSREVIEAALISWLENWLEDLCLEHDGIKRNLPKWLEYHSSRQPVASVIALPPVDDDDDDLEFSIDGVPDWLLEIEQAKELADMAYSEF